MKLGQTPTEIENARKRLLIYTFVGLGGTFLLLFGTISLLQGRLLLAAVLGAALAIGIVAALLARRAIDVQPISAFLALALLVLGSYLLLSGGAEGTGVYWTYPCSMLMVLLVGPRLGSLYMGLHVVASTVFLLGPFTFPYRYPSFEAIRIVATTVALYVLILASEWIRVGAYGAISAAAETNRHQASTDPLTGLLNRSGVENALEERHAVSNAVAIMLDVDRFKAINDRFGHAAGDLVLIRLARVLKEHTKGADLTARWGGEEFLIILFDTSIEAAAALVNRMRCEFERHPFDIAGVSVLVTFSAGMAALDGKAQFEAAVRQADDRLYDAKHSGRNRVVWFDHSPAESGPAPETEPVVAG